jgi:lipoprotein-anchoring transpeptidase ErfK/SrfK
MLKLLLFGGAAGLLLGSAIPPAGSLTGSRLETFARASGSPGVMRSANRWDSEPAAIQHPHPAAPHLRIDWAALDWEPHRPCSIQPITGCVDDRRTAVAAPADGGSVRVVISIPQQKAYVFQDQDLVWTSKVSTGKRVHDTPLGTFTISQKAVRHRSNLYSNAPMPYMQRLTSGGVALHAGHVPGYRASHGCIRLPWSYAKKLYGMTRSGTKVHVTNQRPRTAEEALSLT